MSRMRIWPMAACAAVGVASWSAAAGEAPAQGPAPCGPRDEILSALSQKYSEAPSAIGLTSTGELLQVLTSADHATWSIVVSRADGLSCIVAVGADWQERQTLAKPEQVM